jgi:selenocysteine-specific elongation factor
MSSRPERRLTLGTAGHVDHGKTTLVEALTGTNTDRLAEERRRGLSIELGFAELSLGGRSIGIVDVPGHERLIRTMVAGATGVDMYLMTVAADEGVMPQTREHQLILEALGIRRGVVALTKCDRADGDSLALSRAEAAEAFPSAPVIEVSARDGRGLGLLRDALAELAKQAPPQRGEDAREPGAEPVLHVDRAFTLHGIGTVATGTLWSGELRPGATVRVLPGGEEARIRGLQVHNRDVERAVAGQRVAINLAGMELGHVRRGDSIVNRGSPLLASYRLDVSLKLAEPAKRLHGERIQVHHGTATAAARLVPLGDGYAQLRLESPVVARSGDRVILRRIAPPATLGGAIVLDPAPRRHGAGIAADRLRRIEEGGLETVIAEESRAAEAPARAPAARRAAPRPLDRPSQLALAVLVLDGEEPRAPRALAERLGLEPAEAIAALDRLVAAGKAARVREDLYFATEPLESLRRRAVVLGRDRGELTLPELRDALRTSRKYAQALLEHLDATGVTVRHGDRHVLRRPGTPEEPQAPGRTRSSL